MSDEEKNPIDMYYDMKAGRVKLAQKQEDSGAVSMLNGYLAFLRVMYVIYQHSHWKCAGSNFYGNHLMFQRIYEDAQDLTDSVAEKIIGIYGNNALNHSDQLSLMNEIFSKFNGDDPVTVAIEVTEGFLLTSDDLYNRLKEMDELTLGLDDLIMSNHSKAEEFMFLLRQAKEN